MHESFPFRLAALIMGHRVASTVALAVITAFFAVGCFNVELRTIFSDLLPADDPYVQVFKDHPNFGSPLTMTVMIKRTDGKSIYNPESLQKIWDFTRAIDLTPGVNHTLVVSVASTGARYAEARPGGIEMQPVMGDHPPQTPEEMEQFLEDIKKAPGVRTFLISQDKTAALVKATFIENLLDYDTAFKYVRDLVQEADDAHHDVYLAGQPTLVGWVYHYQHQMLAIFALTAFLLLGALVLYMKNVVGVVIPVVASVVAAIWGFGLAGWLSMPIEPLLMVVPLLLVARTFSHSVQYIERFYEILSHVGDRRKSAEITMGVMLVPSVLGILTDTVGVGLIAIAPIPAMQRFALFAGFWAIAIIPAGVFVISLLLSVMPRPKNVDQIIGEGKPSALHGGIRAVLSFIAKLVTGKTARVTGIVVAVLAVGSFYLSNQISIGNPVEGSNLLWPDSQYNTSVRMINNHFPGINTLEIILESRNPEDSSNRVAVQAAAVQVAQTLQYLMEHSEAPPKASLTFADYISQGNRLYNGGNPKWLPLNPIDRYTNGAAFAFLQGSSPADYAANISYDMQHATVSLWYPDNTQETIEAALAAATKAVAQVRAMNGGEFEDFRIRLGSGTIALQHARNVVVKRYQHIILILLNLAVLGICLLGYRSLVAAVILLIPVNMANWLLLSTMHLMGVGLDINTLMVTVIGVGVGIDYGIYLLSRICEEYHVHENWTDTITTSLRTTGKAILFTANIMLIGILPWYFLSGLKFTADMGLLLVFVMMINMVLALIVLPVLVWWIKPKFASRTDLLVSESIDLSQFMGGDGPRRDDRGPGGEPATAPAG